MLFSLLPAVEKKYAKLLSPHRSARARSCGPRLCLARTRSPGIVYPPGHEPWCSRQRQPACSAEPSPGRLVAQSSTRPPAYPAPQPESAHQPRKPHTPGLGAPSRLELARERPVAQSHRAASAIVPAVLESAGHIRGVDTGRHLPYPEGDHMERMSAPRLHAAHEPGSPGAGAAGSARRARMMARCV